MMPRRSNRPRQTRLNFEPAASSAQKSEAFVRIDPNSSPAKKRKTRLDSPPASSAAPLTSSPSNSQLKVVVNSTAKRTTQLPTPAPSSQVVADERQLDDGNEIEDGLLQRGSRSEANKGVQAIIPSDDEDVIPKSAGKRRPTTILLSSESDASEPITPSSRRTKKCVSRTPSTPLSDRASPVKPRGARSFILGGSSGTAAIPHGQPRSSFGSSKRPRFKIQKPIAIGSSISSSEEDDLVNDSPKRTLRSTAKQPDTRPSPNKPDLSWDFSGSEQSEHVNGTAEKQKRGEQSTSRKDLKHSQATQVESQESSISDSIKSPSSNTKRKQRLAKSRTENFDELELEADLADLKDTETRRTRTRGKTQASARDKRLNKLEELKRRRSGIVEINEDDSAKDDSFLLGDTEPDYDNEDLDEYEADFIQDEGEDETLGVNLAKGGVPLHLTRFANLKPIEYFKYEVEWMIHNKLDPAFERHDEIYEMSHRKLDDEVKGHAGSTYKSAAWGQEFADALTSRPEIFVVEIPAMLEHDCDACNRSGHPPKYQVTLRGHKYDKESLEKVSNDDSEDETQERDGSDEDEPQEVLFLGQVFEGYTSTEKLIARESWNRKKKEKLANKIVDGMVEEGEMKDLYRQFKQNLDFVRSDKVR
ncbi:uncharacterized protein KY384_004953 [Bacidia gigantensis]|uniref:uncharacterized protein n=1 Tax=Bacidia gigantensis TaxID=2732470 RepID=UPI001D05B59A|nr:uncharacterized protein KY384_004953 [Bacidia gigantensis]KAG8530451.1 hypothetical protein KY384_004953 [Bacidia gigantensis]